MIQTDHLKTLEADAAGYLDRLFEMANSESEVAILQYLELMHGLNFTHSTPCRSSPQFAQAKKSSLMDALAKKGASHASLMDALKHYVARGSEASIDFCAIVVHSFPENICTDNAL